MMSLEFWGFTTVLLSLIFNRRYIRHFVALVGGSLLFFSNPEAISKLEFNQHLTNWFGVSVICINGLFVLWNFWLLVMPMYGEEGLIWRKYFRKFSKHNFKKIYRIARLEHKANGSTIVKQGERMPYILVVIDGQASVVVNGEKVATLKNGDFIGEMSYISREKASATVRSDLLTTYLIWEQDKLREVLRKNPSLLIEYHRALEEQLGQKISNSLELNKDQKKAS